MMTMHIARPAQVSEMLALLGKIAHNLRLDAQTVDFVQGHTVVGTSFWTFALRDAQGEIVGLLGRTFEGAYVTLGIMGGREWTLVDASGEILARPGERTDPWGARRMEERDAQWVLRTI